MDVTSTVDDLLRRFEGNDEPAPRSAPRVLPTRGVGWVLKWFAALGVLCFAAGTLLEFFCVMAAERTLARAARAGALEAALPRATLETITDTVYRRIACYPSLKSNLHVMVENNGEPVLGPLRPQQGDRLSVTLAASTHAVLPAWLRTLRFWGYDRLIQVRIEREMPGRMLKAGRESSEHLSLRRGRELSSG